MDDLSPSVSLSLAFTQKERKEGGKKGRKEGKEKKE